MIFKNQDIHRARAHSALVSIHRVSAPNLGRLDFVVRAHIVFHYFSNLNFVIHNRKFDCFNCDFKVDVVVLSFDTASDWCVFLTPQIEIEIPASDCDKEYSRYVN